MAIKEIEVTSRNINVMDLIGLNLSELEQLMVTLDARPFRGRQIYQWMYKKRVFAIDNMSNLGIDFRKVLSEQTSICLPCPISETQTDDMTRKILFKLNDGKKIESVLIPEGDRLTACLSSQAGCRVGCKFCATGKIGFIRNLSVGEITGQFLKLEEIAGRSITNVVMMGMGEPLMNTSAVFKAVHLLTDPDGIGLPRRKVTVSTVGWLPGIKAMIREGLKVKLAVSLNATLDAQRNALIPLASKYSIKEILKAAKDYADSSGFPLSIGYLLLKDVNDSVDDARRLIKLLRSMKPKINLMEYNDTDSSLVRTSERQVRFFYDVLHNAGLTVTIRSSRGGSISAACGQLAADYLNHTNEIEKTV